MQTFDRKAHHANIVANDAVISPDKSIANRAAPEPIERCVDLPTTAAKTPCVENMLRIKAGARVPNTYDNINIHTHTHAGKEPLRHEHKHKRLIFLHV